MKKSKFKVEHRRFMKMWGSGVDAVDMNAQLYSAFIEAVWGPRHGL